MLAIFKPCLASLTALGFRIPVISSRAVWTDKVGSSSCPFDEVFSRGGVTVLKRLLASVSFGVEDEACLAKRADVTGSAVGAVGKIAFCAFFFLLVPVITCVTFRTDVLETIACVIIWSYKTVFEWLETF